MRPVVPLARPAAAAGGGVGGQRRRLGSEGGRGRRPTAEEEAEELRVRNRNLGLYMLAVAVFTVGMSYAAVPLYKMFCQVTGYGGTVQKAKKSERIAKIAKTSDSEGGVNEEDDGLITVSFTADTAIAMPWDFWPVQDSVRVRVGETALAFYTAENASDRPVTGVATYNVNPMKAGLYFNKIQCFCFDEQRLRAREQVDMPVFFFLDPDFADDPRMAGVRDITLSYTFFKSDDADYGDDDDDDDE